MLYKVMIVDDNMSNLIMAQKTLEEEFEVLPVSSGLSALECLHDMPDLPDIVVLDVDMPNVNGFQVISEMKNSRRLRNIPIMFLSAQDDATTELESYNLGALDYIHKPYTASLLKKRINIQIQLLEQKRKLEEINTLLTNVIQGQRKKDTLEQNALVGMLSSLMGKRSVALAAHADRVERYLELFLPLVAAKEVYKLDEDKIQTMCAAARLHDIGKICLKDIFVTGALAGDTVSYDREAERLHTVIGSDAVRKLMPTEELASDFTKYAYYMCRSHHEKFDGTGYPDKLAGEKIPLEARVLSIVNTYDNFRTIKKNGKILGHSDACAKIAVMRKRHFDPLLVDIFLKREKEFAELVQ